MTKGQRTLAGRMLREEMYEGLSLRRWMHANRPRTGADCLAGPRPCPWVGCRYHLALEVGPSGGLTIVRPTLALAEMPFTCALDVAEMGGLVLEDVGAILDVGRERIRQIESEALEAARESELLRGAK